MAGLKAYDDAELLEMARKRGLDIKNNPQPSTRPKANLKRYSDEELLNIANERNIPVREQSTPIASPNRPSASPSPLKAYSDSELLLLADQRGIATQEKSNDPALTEREQELKDYRDAGGGFGTSLERGVRRLMLAPKTAMPPTPPPAEDDRLMRDAMSGAWRTGVVSETGPDAQAKFKQEQDRYMRNILTEMEKISTLPTRPEITRATEEASRVGKMLQEDKDSNKAERYLLPMVQMVTELSKSPEPLSLLGEQMVEQLPVMISSILGTKGAGSLLRGVAPKLASKKTGTSVAVGSGIGVASFANTYGSNYASGLQKGMTPTEAREYAMTRSGVQALVDAGTGAVVPFKIGGATTDIPAQTAIQMMGGGAGEALAGLSVGEEVDPGEIALESVLEAIGLPGDMVAAAVESRRARMEAGDTRNFAAVDTEQETLADQPPPVPPMMEWTIDESGNLIQVPSREVPIAALPAQEKPLLIEHQSNNRPIRLQDGATESDTIYAESDRQTIPRLPAPEVEGVMEAGPEGIRTLSPDEEIETRQRREAFLKREEELGFDPGTREAIRRRDAITPQSLTEIRKQPAKTTEAPQARPRSLPEIETRMAALERLHDTLPAGDPQRTEIVKEMDALADTAIAEVEKRRWKPTPKKPKAARENQKPKTKTAKKQTLLEFIAQRGGINDDRGDLRSMNADLWHRQEPFRRKLLRNDDISDNKYSPDDVARAAWENGYFPEFQERPMINDLYGAIERELSGDPVYKPGEEPEAATPDPESERHDMESYVFSRAEELSIEYKNRDIDDIMADIDEREAIQREGDDAWSAADSIEGAIDIFTQDNDILFDIGEIDGNAETDSTSGDSVSEQQEAFEEVERATTGQVIAAQETQTDQEYDSLAEGGDRATREDAERSAETPAGQSQNQLAVSNVSDQDIETSPSEAQKEAGNYKKGHIKIQGLDVAIENPAGSTRSGTDRDGNTWEVTMPADYGYIKRSEGADGDHVDVYVGDSSGSDQVFIVDQIHADTGKFDEHKIMMGFSSPEAARKAYISAFSDGRGESRIGAFSGAIDIDDFKKWLKEGSQKRPYGALETATEPTEAGEQTVILGAERISDRELAERKMEGRKRSDRPQKEADEGLFDTGARQQSDLLDLPPNEDSERVDRIEDFGEKIGGARKDIWEDYRSSLDKELSEDASTITLSKDFPEPDYEKLLEAGVEIDTLAAIKVLRDSIPAKPRKNYRLKEWRKNVVSARSLAKAMLDGPLKDMSAREIFGTDDADKFANRLKLYVDLGYPAFTKAKGYHVRSALVSILDGKKLDTPKTKWSVTKDSAHGWDRFGINKDTREEAVNALRSLLLGGSNKKPRKTKLDIYRATRTGEIFIGKKVAAGKFIDLKGGFKKRSDALSYMRENEDELFKLLEKKKEVRPVRRSTNDPRIGRDYRKGENITPDQFTEDFGFRGVEFGNYVEQKKRPKDLNNAFDALHDMADLINIPSRAISLNGSLGLAFGARGRGGRNAASAHYEPDYVVINLTKRAGAGSLGHEWWHALDNNIGKRQEGGRFITTSPRLRKTNKDGSPVTEPAIRPETVEAFKGIMDAIQKTELPKRSRSLDNRRTKDYWSTSHEMSARAFEAYLIHKADQKGEANDYLANIISEEAHQASNDILGDDEPYAYPTAQELEEHIVPAFDELFNTLKAKEEDGNVLLYQRRGLGDEDTGRSGRGSGSGVRSQAGDAGETTARSGAKVKELAEWTEAHQAIADEINQIAKDTLGDTVEIAFADQIRTDEGAPAEGFFTRGRLNKGEALRDFIVLALGEGSTDPISAFHHESIHALKAMGALAGNDLALLERASERNWVSQKIKDNYPQDTWVEEGIAFAYQRFKSGKSISKPVDRVFNKLRNFFERVRNYFAGLGYRGADDVFKDIESGKFKATQSASQDEGVIRYQKTDANQVDNHVPNKVLDTLKTEPMQRAVNAVNKWGKRNLTKEGFLNREAFAEKLAMEGAKGESEFDIEAMAFDFKKDVAKAYGKPFSKLSATQKKNIKDYLAGESATIPESLKPRIAHMRGYLDRLSAEMQRSIVESVNLAIEKMTPSQRSATLKYLNTNGESGSIPEHLVPKLEMLLTIERNKGTYLTRSYRAFDDESWKDKALANKDLIKRAESFIAENNPDLNDKEVTGAVRAILQGAKEKGNFVSFMANGSKVGSKDVSLLKRRKDVPPVIRELLGEYEDPHIGFVRSATKMAFYVANHDFLMGIRNRGLGTFLYEKPTGEADALVAGDGSDTMSPLNGLYATEEFKQGMEDAKGVFETGGVMRLYIRLNSAIKYGKTVLSPTTQFRNFMSASMFSMMNGHFDWTQMAKSFAATKADLFTHDQKWRDYLKHLIKIGVIHDNVIAGELRDAIKDATNEHGTLDPTAGAVRRTLNMITAMYRTGDDFWKIMGFENEKALMMKHRGMTEEQAEKEAANRIRNGYPTYSMVPRGVRYLRRAPLVGTFVSFPWEIMRTTRNQFDFIKEDWQAGAKGLAMRRVAGMAVALAAADALSTYSAALLGLGDDDDEAIRNLAPKWQENAALFYLGHDKDGLLNYLDLSHLDPYTYLKNPIRALFNDNYEGLDEKAWASIKAMGEPFFGPDMAATNIMEAMTGQRFDGGKVKDPVGHLSKLLPGIAQNIERTYKAITGEVSPSGKEYTLRDEGLGWIGFRLTSLNIPQSLMYRGYELQDRKREASSMLSYKTGKAGNVSDDTIRDAYKDMVEERENAYREMMRHIEAARKLGMEDRDIIQALRASKVAKKDISAMMRGRIPKWNMSSQFLRSATERANIAATTGKKKKDMSDKMKHRKALIKSLSTERKEEEKPEVQEDETLGPRSSLETEAFNLADNNPHFRKLLAQTASISKRNQEAWDGILSELG